MQPFTDSLGHPLPQGAPLDRMAHFNRERIPERVTHAAGTGAFGRFTAYEGAPACSSAHFLAEAGRQTPAFVRFSLMSGRPGAAESMRDVRGMAVKLYTQEGICDWVAQHLPVYFLRTADRFPDLVHALGPDPTTGLYDPTRLWDFCACLPETTQALIYLYSDLGTLKSYRYMDAYGVNTYRWTDAQGTARLARWRWTSLQGRRTLTRQEAQRLKATDPQCATRDLTLALEQGYFPEWELQVQLLLPAEAEMVSFDPLDATHSWPEGDHPWRPVGRLRLDRLPTNAFAQVEQAAFSPANLVPGMAASADPLLRARLWASGDAQRYRLGVNYGQLPVNRAANGILNFQQDGAMAFDLPEGPINYAPNASLPEGLPRGGGVPGNANPYAGRQDDYAQAGAAYRALSPEEQDNLIDNLAEQLAHIPQDIGGRAAANLYEADRELGRRMTDAAQLYAQLGMQ